MDFGSFGGAFVRKRAPWTQLHNKTPDKKHTEPTQALVRKRAPWTQLHNKTPDKKHTEPTQALDGELLGLPKAFFCSIRFPMFF